VDSSLPPPLLAADSSAGPIWLGLLTGVASFVVSRWLYDVITIHLRRRRLIDALLVECVTTIRKFDPVLPIIKKLDLRKETPSLERARSLISGIILADPLKDLTELLTLLKESDQIKDVVQFFDRWARFIAFEQRYAVVYEKLLEVASDSSSAEFMQMYDEYWSRATSILQDMYRLGNELCGICCGICRRHGPYDDEDLDKLTDGLWKSWGECVSRRDFYRNEAKKVARDVQPAGDGDSAESPSDTMAGR
jgi:hypothetical protein